MSPLPLHYGTGGTSWASLVPFGYADELDERECQGDSPWNQRRSPRKLPAILVEEEQEDGVGVGSPTPQVVEKKLPSMGDQS